MSLLLNRPEIYSDFTKELMVSPINSDVMRISNEESIKESIRNLVSTNRGERLFQPQIGCDIRKLLFENITPDTVITAKAMIRETIESFEPRAGIVSIDVTSSIDSNIVNITIVFHVIDRADPISLTINVSRIR